MMGAVSKQWRNEEMPRCATRVNGTVRHSPPGALAFFRRYGAECGSELCMHDQIHWPMFDPGAGGVLAKIVVAFPVL
jgi:hypothetical protein